MHVHTSMCSTWNVVTCLWLGSWTLTTCVKVQNAKDCSHCCSHWHRQWHCHFNTLCCLRCRCRWICIVWCESENVWWMGGKRKAPSMLYHQLKLATQVQLANQAGGGCNCNTQKSGESETLRLTWRTVPSGKDERTAGFSCMCCSKSSVSTNCKSWWKTLFVLRNAAISWGICTTWAGELLSHLTHEVAAQWIPWQSRQEQKQ